MGIDMQEFINGICKEKTNGKNVDALWTGMI
jgi:hypothetical protein